METTETILRHEAIAQWLKIIENGDINEIGVGMPDLSELLTEPEILSIKIALLDGWDGLNLFNKTSKHIQIVGYNKALSAQYGSFPPRYAQSVDAIAGALARISASYDIGRHQFTPQYKAVAWIDNHLRSFQGDTMAIALCKLYLAIAPVVPKPKPLIEVIETDESNTFEAEFI